MAFQLVARLGLSARGFFSALRPVGSKLRALGRTAGGDFSKEFGKAVAIEGALAGIRRLFAKKAEERGPDTAARRFSERVEDPVGVRRRFALGLTAAGAAAAFLAHKGAEAVGEIKDMAEQADVSTNDVQKLDRAARNSGLSFDHFATSLDAVGASRKEAVQSNDELLAQFARFGITLQDLQNPELTNLDLLKKIGAAMQHMDLSPRLRQDLRDIGGKTLPKLGNALRELATTNPTLIKPEAIQAIDTASKRAEKLMATLKAFAANTLGGIIQKLLNAVDNLENKLDRLSKKYPNALSTAGNVAKKGIGLAASSLRGAALTVGGLPAAAIDKIAQVGAKKVGELFDDPAKPEPTPAPGPRPNVNQPAKDAPLFDETEALEKEKQLQKRLEEVRFKGLDEAEKETALRKAITTEQLKIRRIEDLGTPTARDRVKLLEAQTEEQTLKNDLKDLLAGANIKEQTDDLARIGGFTANAGSDRRLQERIAAAAEETAANTRGGGNKDITQL